MTLRELVDLPLFSPKDLLILKVTTSGVQSVPLALDNKFKEFEFHGNYAYRYKIIERAKLR